MNKISLRIGLNHNWNNLYYHNLSYLDPRLSHGNLQLPKTNCDNYVKRVINGFIKYKHLEIHQSREFLDIYISNDRSFNNSFFSSIPSTKNRLAVLRVLLNILKTRIQIYNLYTFPIHDAELLIKYLLKDYKNKSRFNIFKTLLNLGIIKGVKIKIKGRYKKSTRTQNEIYQFGQIPNTPTTNLKTELFYSTSQLIGSLGTSSLHIYLVYKI
jgi:hypothetical protein